MKFTAEKKHSIIMYLLEQIYSGQPDVSKTVAEKCDISRNTVNNYLGELEENEIIKKVKRNSYELIEHPREYTLSREKNELESDTYFYDRFFKKHIENCTDEAKQIWQYAISEMVNNVIDHSAADKLNILVQQNYLNTMVVLYDDGVGIFNKIKEHFSFATLDEARQELFKGKLTTDSDNHSGEGIFFTSRLMDTFLIISSEMVFTTNKYNQESNFNLGSSQLDGTCVVMILSNFTHRRISDIFDQYSNIEDGFTKTVIPMRGMFDSAPVSRSQAKRVCHRLDSFKEIVLDFDGLDWMGQAFAHQLFVVYRNQHPDMVMTPINMNDEVAKMYSHVMNTR